MAIAASAKTVSTTALPAVKVPLSTGIIFLCPFGLLFKQTTDRQL